MPYVMYTMCRFATNLGAARALLHALGGATL